MSSSSNVPDPEGWLKQGGWLWKKGSKGLVKGFKKRWFQLNEDIGQLEYYSSSDTSVPVKLPPKKLKLKGTIPLASIDNVHRIGYDSKTGRWGVNIEVTDRVYVLQANSQEACRRFSSTLAQTAFKIRIRSDTYDPLDRLGDGPNFPFPSSGRAASMVEPTADIKALGVAAGGDGMPMSPFLQALVETPTDTRPHRSSSGTLRRHSIEVETGHHGDMELLTPSPNDKRRTLGAPQNSVSTSSMSSWWRRVTSRRDVDRNLTAMEEDLSVKRMMDAVSLTAEKRVSMMLHTPPPSKALTRLRRGAEYESDSASSSDLDAAGHLFDIFLLVGAEPMTPGPRDPSPSSSSSSSEGGDTALGGDCLDRGSCESPRASDSSSRSKLPQRVLFAYPPTAGDKVDPHIARFCFPIVNTDAESDAANTQGGAEVHPNRDVEADVTGTAPRNGLPVDSSEHVFVQRWGDLADLQHYYGCCVTVWGLSAPAIRSRIHGLWGGQPQSSPKDAGITSSDSSTGLCFCLLSRYPFLSLHFSILHALVRLFLLQLWTGAPALLSEQGPGREAEPDIAARVEGNANEDHDDGDDADDEGGSDSDEVGDPRMEGTVPPSRSAMKVSWSAHAESGGGSDAIDPDEGDSGLKIRVAVDDDAAPEGSASQNAVQATDGTGGQALSTPTPRSSTSSHATDASFQTADTHVSTPMAPEGSSASHLTPSIMLHSSSGAHMTTVLEEQSLGGAINAPSQPSPSGSPKSAPAATHPDSTPSSPPRAKKKSNRRSAMRPSSIIREPAMLRVLRHCYASSVPEPGVTMAIHPEGIGVHPSLSFSYTRPSPLVVLEGHGMKHQESTADILQHQQREARRRISLARGGDAVVGDPNPSSTATETASEASPEEARLTATAPSQQPSEKFEAEEEGDNPRRMAQVGRAMSLVLPEASTAKDGPKDEDKAGPKKVLPYTSALPRMQRVIVHDSSCLAHWCMCKAARLGMSVTTMLEMACALALEHPLAVAFDRRRPNESPLDQEELRDVLREVEVVSAVAMAAVPLLGTFQSQGAFIPILPWHLHEMVDAPIPYVLGVISASPITWLQNRHLPMHRVNSTSPVPERGVLNPAKAGRSLFQRSISPLRIRGRSPDGLSHQRGRLPSDDVAARHSVDGYPAQTHRLSPNARSDSARSPRMRSPSVPPSALERLRARGSVVVVVVTKNEAHDTVHVEHADPVDEPVDASSALPSLADTDRLFPGLGAMPGKSTSSSRPPPYSFHVEFGSELAEPHSLPRQEELVSAMEDLHARAAQEDMAAAEEMCSVLHSYYSSMLSELQIHTVTDSSDSAHPVTILVAESFLEAAPATDRQFLEGLFKTQLFQVYSDACLQRRPLKGS